MSHWKIVRDKDEEVCKPLGVSGVWRPSKTAVAGLARKVFEEAAEFSEGLEAGELYDLLGVINELLTRIDPNSVARAKHEKKVAKRGTFTRAIEWSPVPEGAQDDD